MPDRMFVTELIYKASLTEIDAHMTFLNKYCASGNFLISGRKIPAVAASSWQSARVANKSKASPEPITGEPRHVDRERPTACFVTRAWRTNRANSCSGGKNSD